MLEVLIHVTNKTHAIIRALVLRRLGGGAVGAGRRNPARRLGNPGTNIALRAPNWKHRTSPHQQHNRSANEQHNAGIKSRQCAWHYESEQLKYKQPEYKP